MDKKNQYRLIVDMKKYLKTAEECDFSTLDSLISEVKAYIYENKELKEEYEKHLKKFEDIKKQESYNHYIADFCDIMQTLFKKFNNHKIQFHSGQDPNGLYFSYFNWYYPEVKEQLKELNHFLFDEGNGGIFETYLYVAELYLMKNGKIERLKWISELRDCFRILQYNIKSPLAEFYFLELENKYYDFFNEDSLLVFLFKVSLIRVLKYLINYTKRLKNIQQSISKNSKADKILDLYYKDDNLTHAQIAERVGTTKNYVKKVIHKKSTPKKVTRNHF